ncbi:MAG: DUF1552 domain-containing protein [Polyangiales bacterium]
MTVRRMGRRMFLLGAGGAALAMPFLPSLLEPRAARAAPSERPKRFVAMTTGHGGVWGEFMWPADSMADQGMSVLGSNAHNFRHGTLTPRVEGSEHVLSDVIRGPASRLSAGLIAKMNLLRGLDIPWYCAHGAHSLGNYGPMMLAESAPSVPDQATLDQVLAWSPCTYPTTPRRRSMHIGHNVSTVWVNPSTRSGGFQPVASSQSSLGLFNEVYVAPPDPMGPPPRPRVTNRVMESYRRLTSGAHGPGSRLGRADRERLEAYMDHITSLEASLGAGVAASCADVTVPLADARDPWPVWTDRRNEPAWYGPNYYQLYNDVLIAAFMCDGSRVATIGSPDDWDGSYDSWVGGYHNGVAHEAGNGNTEAAGLLVGTNRTFFQMVYLDLIAKMDAAPDEEGTTLLDNALVWWTHESGPQTHLNDSQPVIMAGSAGGAFNTGMYVDYRTDRAFPRTVREGGGTGRRPGLHYYQWFTTVLDAFGIPRAEWQEGTQPFSPSGPVATWLEVAHPYQDAILNYCDVPLPLLLNA